jgi:hypothetical protein
VDATLEPLVGSTTLVQILPLVGSTSSTNPSYTFTVLVNDWKPLAGKIGELEKVSATWPISGAVTRATS